jgi:hypothetical protein
MGTMISRPQLVSDINHAFHPTRIAETAARLANLPPAADAFDHIHALGLFNLASQDELESYRSSLPIPPLNREVLAAAFRFAVANKVPLSFAIVGGNDEAVHVSTSDKLVSVVLTRID